MITRLFRHLLLPDWWRRRHLTETVVERIRATVARAEGGHGAEIKVAVEASLDLLPVLRGVTARERALDVFSALRVWDTEHNDGVLLYVLLADRDVEIVADRGLSDRVSQADWERICREMEALFRAGRQEEALLQGAAEIGKVLEDAYPGEKNTNQLSDHPVML